MRATYNALCGTPEHLYCTWYVIMWNRTLLVRDDTTSAVSTKVNRECGIVDETSMPPLKCRCFGSAA